MDELQRLLEAAGIMVWRDTEQLWPGEDWRVAVRRAIANDTLVFLACFSRASSARWKSHQTEELLLATDEHRKRRPDQPWLIPVRFDDSEIPDLPLSSGRTLTSIQRCDLFGERRDREAARLVAAIRQVLGQDAADASAAVPGHRDVAFLVGQVSPVAGGLQALVISADGDAGFADDLGLSLLGLGAEFPLGEVSLLTVGPADTRPDGQAHPAVCKADVVLLVVSRDLLSTVYGLSPDVRVLLERHESREAVVVPLLFRAASWERQPFGKLVALPANGVPVTGWKSFDEAMRSITGSLSVVIKDFLERGSVRSGEETPWDCHGETQNLGNVFKFSGVPVLTFVEPRDFQVFRMALRQPGLGIVLEGPSGIGKTTILRHAVKQDAHRLGEVRLLSARRPADIADIERLPDGHAGLVAIDDFHRLPGPLQDEIADYLKLLADDDASAKLVVVGIPGTARNLVMLGVDLATRIEVFRPERAADSLVQEMIEKGEAALNIRFAAKSEIVVASKGSLQTAQKAAGKKLPAIRDQIFICYSHQDAGCFTRGSTIEECRARAVEAIETHIAGLQADGEMVPEEVGEAQLQGRPSERGFWGWPAGTVRVPRARVVVGMRGRGRSRLARVRSDWRFGSGLRADRWLRAGGATGSRRRRCLAAGRG